MTTNKVKIMNKLSLAIILIFLFLVFLIFGYVGIVQQSTPAYSLAGSALVFLVALWAVGILDYKIGGATISLEKEVKALAQDNKELRIITTTLVKTIFAVMDASYRVGGPTKEHENLTAKYIDSISKYLDADIIKQWNKDYDSMHGTP